MARIEEFVALCRVVEHRSFSIAAETLGMSQPAISLQIKSLEAEYGTDLLHRSSFGIVPTKVGSIIYEYACQVVDLYEESKVRANELAGCISGRIHVGASTGPGDT